jgi:hypothetical protein
MIFDDHRVPPRSLEEIEAEANRCRAFAPIDIDGRIDMFGLLKAWSITFRPKSDSEMGDDEAVSSAKTHEIFGRRNISQGLRFGEPHARYVVGHEVGHMFLHRSDSPKPRKISGNTTYAFIHENESSERQAWKFARALFITREGLNSGDSDDDIAFRVGIPVEAVQTRRKEVEKAIQASLPKAVPSNVIEFLEKARRTNDAKEFARKQEARADLEKRAAWSRAAQVVGESPLKVRAARGFRVEWDDYGNAHSDFGWTIVHGEIRSFLDLRTS